MPKSRVLGLSMVKNEVDVITDTLRHMLWHVDDLLVIDNDSTDGTLEIIQALQQEHPGRITLFHDDEVAYEQSRKMTEAAHFAITGKPSIGWIVPFDADEIWSVRGHPDLAIADYLSSVDEDVWEQRATLYDHVPTRFDPKYAPPMRAIEWRRSFAGKLPKVAFRPVGKFTIEMGNHEVTYEEEPPATQQYGELVVDHFPYRSAQQFIKKIRQGYTAITAADLPLDRGAHWRAYGEMDDDGLVAHYEKWFAVKNPHEHSDLRWSPAPLKA